MIGSLVLGIQAAFQGDEASDEPTLGLKILRSLGFQGEYKPQPGLSSNRGKAKEAPSLKLRIDAGKRERADDVIFEPAKLANDSFWYAICTSIRNVLIDLGFPGRQCHLHLCPEDLGPSRMQRWPPKNGQQVLESERQLSTNPRLVSR